MHKFYHLYIHLSIPFSIFFKKCHISYRFIKRHSINCTILCTYHKNVYSCYIHSFLTCKKHPTVRIPLYFITNQAHAAHTPNTNKIGAPDLLQARQLSSLVYINVCKASSSRYISVCPRKSTNFVTKPTISSFFLFST